MDNKCTYFIACKDARGQDAHFPVPSEVYVYVRQLENKIIHPEQSKLTDIYPHLKAKEIE